MGLIKLINYWINVLVFCLIVAACWGSPVGLQQEKEKGPKDGAPAGKNLCNQTPYGCVDLSDPRFSPMDHETVINPGNSTNENGELGSIHMPPCIPTAWGCIDPSDPSFRPK